MCDSKELLVGFLYDELDVTDRPRFETHLASCAECRDELAGFRATRGQIAQWAPPEPDFAFTIVRRATAPQPAGRFRVSREWGLAAAALLVMGLGAAIAHIEVRLSGDGLTVRTGWQRDAVSPASLPASSDAARGTPPEWTAQVAALNERLHRLETSPAPPLQPAAAGNQDANAVLRQVRDMLAASEMRQQRALTKISRDFDTQRQVDLATISQSMTRLQNTSDAEVKQYRDLILRTYRNTAFQQNGSQR
jgi:anti-sigma factor RsiW